MINNYKAYLNVLDKRLGGMFERQAPFIKCKRGCAYCCKEGDYPLSELEYIYIMMSCEELPDDIKAKINSNIMNLLAKEDVTMYECPFLINDECLVYEARGLICRTFGLLSYTKNGRNKMPFCIEFGLNYADVYDKEKGMLVRNADDGTEPVAFNISRPVLRSKEVEHDFGIFFGEDKTMLDWLREDFTSQEEQQPELQ